MDAGEIVFIDCVLQVLQAVLIYLRNDTGQLDFANAEAERGLFGDERGLF